MKVVVYVEGASGKVGMEVLLAPLLAKQRERGVSIDFFESPKGDRKETLLTRVPVKAVNVLLNNPSAIVIALPDLYPRDKAFPHATPEELERGLRDRFHSALAAKGWPSDGRFDTRFRVFCFKHDLEALLLAAEEALAAYLSLTKLKATWTRPVEDQNHKHPPKHVVEELFRKHGQAVHWHGGCPADISRQRLPEDRRSMPAMFSAVRAVSRVAGFGLNRRFLLYALFAFFTSSVSAGTTSNRSPTMP